MRSVALQERLFVQSHRGAMVVTLTLVVSIKMMTVSHRIQSKSPSLLLHGFVLLCSSDSKSRWGQLSRKKKIDWCAPHRP